MKKINLFVIAFIISGIVNAQNPVPNHSFETWSGNPLNADGWYTNGAGSNVLITRVPGHTGNYAAQGNVIHFNGGELTAPYLGCNFPVNERHDYIQFYYKANLDSDDVFQIAAAIYDTSSNILAVNFYNIVFSTSNFTPFYLYLDSVLTGVPDHAVITFTIIPHLPNPTPHINSSFVVDDVEFLFGTIGIQENEISTNYLIYPNPADENIFLEFNTNGNKSSKIFLYDTKGNLVFQKETSIPVNGKISEKLNVEGVASGIYMLRIINEKDNFLRKVVIE